MHGINLPTVTVILTPALLRLFPTAEARSRVSAVSVDHMLDELDKRWPGIRDRIADTSPAIRRHITVFVDGERARLDTPLRDDGTVYILTAVSGG